MEMANSTKTVRNAHEEQVIEQLRRNFRNVSQFVLADHNDFITSNAITNEIVNGELKLIHLLDAIDK